MTTAPASKLHPQLSFPGGRAGLEAVLNLRPPVQGLVREEAEDGRSPSLSHCRFPSSRQTLSAGGERLKLPLKKSNFENNLRVRRTVGSARNPRLFREKMSYFKLSSLINSCFNKPVQYLSLGNHLI